MTISFACPQCKAEYEVENSDAGCLTDCPECGTEITVPNPPASRNAGGIRIPRGAIKTHAASALLAGTTGAVQAVTVTNIKMSFGAMVVFMIKWAIASIPAMIILFLIGALAAVLSSSIIAAGCSRDKAQPLDKLEIPDF